MHAFLLLAVFAADPDIESMKRSLEAQIGLYQRMNDLERRVTILEQKGGDPPSVVVTPQDADSGAVKHEASSDSAPVPKTAICQCRGSNRGVCFCLQRGVACRCNASKGSVWNLDEQGRATAKTGQYADPRSAKTSAKTGADSGNANPRQGQTPARSVAPAAPAPQQMIRIQPMQRYCPNCVRQYRFRDDD